MSGAAGEAPAAPPGNTAQVAQAVDEDVKTLTFDAAADTGDFASGADFAGGSRPDAERELALTRVNLDGAHVWTTWLPGLMRPHLAVAPGGQSWPFGSCVGTRAFGDFTLTAPSRQGVLLRLAP